MAGLEWFSARARLLAVGAALAAACGAAEDANGPAPAPRVLPSAGGGGPVPTTGGAGGAAASAGAAGLAGSGTAGLAGAGGISGGAGAAGAVGGGTGGVAGSAGATSDALGANLAPGGAWFRVWAPAASAVVVEGDFAAAPVPMIAGTGGVFSVFVPGAKAGDRYRYRLTHDGAELIRLDPRGRQRNADWSVLVDPGAFVWKTAAFTPPARREAVVYELHVGSFADTHDPPTGTFAQVAAKLPLLADLGINVIEMLPTNDFGSKAGWGYNPQSYFAPRVSYGTPDDLRSLVDAAHGLGIAVVLDVVYNHYDGWSGAPLRCFDGDCPGGSAGVYFFTDPAYTTTPWGPRPAFSTPQVKDFLLAGLSSWIDEYRVDGFRWDSTSNIRGLDGKGDVPGGAQLMRDGIAETRAHRPGSLSIAEDLKGWDGLTKSAAEGGIGFDAQWDGFVYPISDALVGPDDAARDMNAVKAALLGSYNGDPFQRLLCVENHDTVGNGSARLPQRIDPKDPGSWAARKRSMLAAGLLLTAPGIPMLFMGQEMLERGSFTPTPPPLDWDKLTAYGPVRSFFRDMIRLRRNQGGVSGGLLGKNVAVHHVNDAAKVIGYRRWDEGGDDVIVLANLSAKKYTQYDLGLPAGGTWKIRVDADRTAYSTDFGGGGPDTVVAKDVPRDGLPHQAGFVLGPYSIIVASR